MVAGRQYYYLFLETSGKALPLSHELCYTKCSKIRKVTEGGGGLLYHYLTVTKMKGNKIQSWKLTGGKVQERSVYKLSLFTWQWLLTTGQLTPPAHISKRVLIISHFTLQQHCRTVSILAIKTKLFIFLYSGYYPARMSAMSLRVSELGMNCCCSFNHWWRPQFLWCGKGTPQLHLKRYLNINITIRGKGIKQWNMRIMMMMTGNGW